MHNIENKCKKFKNASKFIYFAKSSLQNMISCSALWIVPAREFVLETAIVVLRVLRALQ